MVMRTLLAGADGQVSCLLSRWIFLRALGLISLVAFVSFWVQARGLVGSAGILPLNEYLQAVRDQLGPIRYWRCPTVFWLNSSDTAIHIVCAAGVAASVMLTIGLAPIPALVAIWGLYLSISIAGQDFLSFQWDILLTETCFLAIFLAPPQLLPGLARESLAPRAAQLLLWWLIFRLMFESGVVKLTSGDLTWLNLTALDYHYYSQPLPTWIGWYAHHLPDWFDRLCVFITYVIEIGLPLCIFASQPLRLTACAGFVVLNVLILATGNYTFFNLLAIALSLFLVDDGIWSQVLPDRLLGIMGYTAGNHTPAGSIHAALTLAVALLFAVVGTIQVLSALAPGNRALYGAEYRLNVLAPLRSLNGYGLFRVMTTRRLEIEVEGSLDGHRWRAYEFKWKPDDLRRCPGFVEPHQPRLDWQMWFAALSSFDDEPWFQRFLATLLEGRQDVLALLRANPFPEGPPRYVRALLYEYEPTSLAEHRETGAWWKRKLLGAYSPTLQIRPGGY